MHVEAGIHEAQEMVQLKLENSALTEEVALLRSIPNPNPNPDPNPNPNPNPNPTLTLTSP